MFLNIKHAQPPHLVLYEEFNFLKPFIIKIYETPYCRPQTRKQNIEFYYRKVQYSI